MADAGPGSARKAAAGRPLTRLVAALAIALAAVPLAIGAAILALARRRGGRR